MTPVTARCAYGLNLFWNPRVQTLCVSPGDRHYIVIDYEYESEMIWIIVGLYFLAAGELPCLSLNAFIDIQDLPVVVNKLHGYVSLISIQSLIHKLKIMVCLASVLAA